MEVIHLPHSAVLARLESPQGVKSEVVAVLFPSFKAALNSEVVMEYDVDHELDLLSSLIAEAQEVVKIIEDSVEGPIDVYEIAKARMNRELYSDQVLH